MLMISPFVVVIKSPVRQPYVCIQQNSHEGRLSETLRNAYQA